MNNIILGAGLSGLTLGDLFNQREIPFSIFEKENQTGGLCVTTNVNNFLFDKTGHLLYFRDKQTKNYLIKRLKIKLKKQEKNSIIIYKKNIIPYPFQLNLWALPKIDREHCITSIMKLSKQIIKHGDISRNAENFRDWTINNFGKGIAQKFLLPYNRKLWRIPLKELSLGWLGDFVPKPDYSDILNSAIEKPENKVGYNPYFYYPEKGGIQVLINKLTSLVKLNT
ncbi:NAD(P)-binding protein, partial [Candidatus Dependentiae bacterium]|nr:NAD(P)-binding protein [Candidatus Dependentiae bacterium]